MKGVCLSGHVPAETTTTGTFFTAWGLRIQYTVGQESCLCRQYLRPLKTTDEHQLYVCCLSIGHPRETVSGSDFSGGWFFSNQYPSGNTVLLVVYLTLLGSTAVTSVRTFPASSLRTVDHLQKMLKKLTCISGLGLKAEDCDHQSRRHFLMQEPLTGSHGGPHKLLTTPKMDQGASEYCALRRMCCGK